MTASGRQLLQQDLDGQPAITTVTTALQFLEAVNTAVGHIVVLEHINVAGTYESGGHSIPVNSDVLSLTGNCQTAPDLEALQLTSLPRRPLSLRQCIVSLSTEQGLNVSTHRDGMWIDNMYFIETGTSSVARSKPVAEVSNLGSARMFLTRLTLQGNGATPAASAATEMVRITGEAPILWQDVHFVDFVVVDSALVSLSAGQLQDSSTSEEVFVRYTNCSFDSIGSVGSGSIIATEGPVLVWLEECEVVSSTISRTQMFVAGGRRSDFYDDQKRPYARLSVTLGEDYAADGLPLNTPQSRPGSTLFFLSVDDDFISETAEILAQQPMPQQNPAQRTQRWAAVGGGIAAAAVLALLAAFMFLFWWDRRRKKAMLGPSAAGGHHAVVGAVPDKGTIGHPQAPGVATASEDSLSQATGKGGSTVLQKDRPHVGSASAGWAEPDTQAVLAGKVDCGTGDSGRSSGKKPPSLSVSGEGGIDASEDMKPLPMPGQIPDMLGSTAASEIASAGIRTRSTGVTTSFAAFITTEYSPAVAAGEMTSKQQRERLVTELDHMRRHDELFLGQYAVLPWTERREGGQGVVQFMRSTRTDEAVAVKFFLSRTALETELELYDVEVLRSMMPAVKHEVRNADKAERNSRGYPWPPCIVLEKGESLQEWKAKTQPAFSTIVDALCLITERLAQLHGSGWVHRDLKPGNVLRLPGQHSWTLMDFGCAARSEATVSLTFSPSYAPPEAAQANERGDHTIVADAAADMWALGIMAVELLTSRPVFPPLVATRESIWAQLCGREALPWEDGAAGQREVLRQLRGLKRAVLQCLQRDPAQRPTAVEVLTHWRNLFDSRTVAE